MKRFIIASLLVLFAGVAAAQQSPAIGASNQIVDPINPDATVTVNNVSLPQAGFVTVTVPDQYGDVDGTARLGRVYLSAGHHENVKVPLNSQALDQHGYTEGTEHKAFVEVTPAQPANAGARDTTHMNQTNGKPGAVKSIQIRVPDPVDEVS